jgi:HK97 family phage major capsid protein
MKTMRTKLEEARELLAQRKREFRELASEGTDESLTASEARENGRHLRAAEKLLREAENRVAVWEARQLVKPVDTEPMRGDGMGRAAAAWGAIARGELYSENVYRPDTGASFFRDMAAVRDDPSAQERLRRNQEEGLAQLDLQANVTTGDPGLTGIVPPAYLQDMWAEVPRASRPFADAIGSRPLIEYGMTVNVPRLTTGAAVASQATQGQPVEEQDPDTDTINADVVTIAGQVDLSRQALERSTPGADTVIFADLMNAYDAELDRQLIDGAGSGGEHLGILHMTPITITWTASTPTAADLLRKIFNAIQQVASARYQPPEVIVLHPRRGADLASSLSTSQPLFPLSSAANRALGTSNAGFTDDIAGLRVLLDANMPTNAGAGTNQDIIAIVRTSDLLLYEQPLRQLRFEQVLSGSLEVRLQCYSYSAFIPHRWTSSVAIVTGTGLVNPW